MPKWIEMLLNCPLKGACCQLGVPHPSQGESLEQSLAAEKHEVWGSWDGGKTLLPRSPENSCSNPELCLKQSHC